MSKDLPNARRTRWAPAIAVVVLAIIASVMVHFSERVDDSFRIPLTALIVVVTLLLLGLWFLFFTALRWRTRLAILGGAAVLVVMVGILIRYNARIEGSMSGRGIPRLVWKWSKPIDPPT